MTKLKVWVDAPKERTVEAFAAFLEKIPELGSGYVASMTFGQLRAMRSQFWDRFDAATSAGVEMFTFKPAAEAFESPNQPRDERGRWTSGGGGGGAGGGGSESAAMGSAAIKNVAAQVNAWKQGEEVGFSVKLTDGSSPTDGYMMSGAKGREFIKPARELTEMDVRDYVDRNMDLLSNPDAHLGGWVSNDDGNVYLDVSVRVQNYDSAWDACDAMGEKAFYDVKRGVSVYLNQDRDGQRPESE